MSIVFAGSTSGTITLQEPAVAGTNTITLPASTGTLLTTGSPQSGGVIQVANAVLSGLASTSSSTYADSGLTVSITPKFATSKILVIVDCVGCSHGTNNTALQLRLVRNSTSIVLIEDYAGNPTGVAAESYTGGSGCSFLDSPATTSATVYKVQFASRANTAVAYINNYGSVNSVTSTITVMEIAA